MSEMFCHSAEANSKELKQVQFWISEIGEMMDLHYVNCPK